MNALVQTFVSCVATGAVFTSFCAALVVPVFAWIAVRSLAPAIHRMSGDWRPQAALAAWSASVPGGLFVFLVLYGLASSGSAPCLQTIPGRTLFGTLAAMMLAAIARAIAHAFRRKGEATRICATAVAPSTNLAHMASRVGVVAFEIPDNAQSIVMLYGERNPAVYVSTKALYDLSEDELLAALYHEHAHQTHGDHRVAPALYFLADLLPLSVADLVETYRRSRELCADQCAVQHVAASDLAGALLQMVSPKSASPVHAAAFADATVLHERLHALLFGDLPTPNHFRRVVVAASLFAIVAVGVSVPPLASLIFHCSMGLSS